MSGARYRYVMKSAADLTEARETLRLSLLAVEAIFGEMRLRLDARYSIDEDVLAIIVAADTEVGQRLNEVFLGYLVGEFGEDDFTVTRMRGGLDAGRSAA